jgi:hypothetical protein
MKPTMPKHEKEETTDLIKEWALPPAATLGSSVRAKGILLEVRARLPKEARKSLDVDGSKLTLVMPDSDRAGFRSASAVISETLENIESLPVIPREIQDILTITTTERHRWLKDGRLPSTGTRTVRLAGRAKQITFHVFDPRLVEDLLDRGLVDEWREEDVIAASEKRQQAVWNRKLTRDLTKSKTASAPKETEDDRTELRGWEEFGRDGLLR